MELKWGNISVRGARGESPNCTLVELKSVWYVGKEDLTSSPNCTLVELKCAFGGFFRGFIVNSKLYLSGIEMKNEKYKVAKRKVSKLYLSGIEIDQKRFTSLLSSTPNCTLV